MALRPHRVNRRDVVCSGRLSASRSSAVRTLRQRAMRRRIARSARTRRAGRLRIAIAEDELVSKHLDTCAFLQLFRPAKPCARLANTVRPRLAAHASRRSIRACFALEPHS
ncbi:hypothetical protein WS91_06420 [Burkholderia sp. MSMB1498]|nr:hypothetical protein WS91_06420 [Burkholderia sp. MSMB1498]